MGAEWGWCDALQRCRRTDMKRNIVGDGVRQSRARKIIVDGAGGQGLFGKANMFTKILDGHIFHRSFYLFGIFFILGFVLIRFWSSFVGFEFFKTASFEVVLLLLLLVTYGVLVQCKIKKNKNKQTTILK